MSKWTGRACKVIKERYLKSWFVVRNERYRFGDSDSNDDSVDANDENDDDNGATDDDDDGNEDDVDDIYEQFTPANQKINLTGRICTG